MASSYRTFSVDPALDHSLHTLVTRTLPLASHYSVVSRFVEESSKFIHGMVNQVSISKYVFSVSNYFISEYTFSVCR